MCTHMIVYYVEGHEGHISSKAVGQQSSRSSVSGQRFSFAMPWTQMLREFHTRVGEEDFLALPRDAYTLQYLFRVHLQVAEHRSYND